jgi:uncharacterized RDD family membrane protein YckC
MQDTSDVERCGLGIRGVAMAIDSVVWFVLLFVAVYLIAIPTGQLETTQNGVDAELEGTAGALGLALWLALSIGYHTVSEWRFGATVGKSLVKIRVASEDGSPATLRAALVRNVARLVDWLPLFYLVGIVALVVSDGHRRLGDRWADTVVVRS